MLRYLSEARRGLGGPTFPIASVDSVLRRFVSFLCHPRQLAAFVLAVYSVAVGVAATTRLYDPDVWWVAAAGRQMLSAHSLPAQNLFSFTDAAQPWLMHEWLFGVPYAFGLAAWGPRFFTLVTLVSLGIGLLFITRGTLGRARHAGAGLVLAFVAMTFFGARLLSARPTGVAELFPLALCLLAFAPEFSVRRASAVVVVELAWANSHGSFPLGIALLATAALDAERQRGRRFLAAVAAALVTLLNPHGARLHGFVWQYLSGKSGIYREIQAGIHEFRSVIGAFGDAIGVPDLTGLGLVTLLAASALGVPKHRVRAGFCLCLIVAALRQVRHVSLAGLITCLLMLPWLDEFWAKRVLASGVEDAKPRYLQGLLLAVPAALAVLLFSLVPARRSDGEATAEGPAFLKALHAVKAGANLYAPFSEAGMAIWYGFPRGVRVFFDSRNDCYSPETFRAFVRLGTRDTPRAVQRELLAQSATTSLLIPRGHPLEFVRDEPTWTQRFAEGGWLLFERAAGDPR